MPFPRLSLAVTLAFALASCRGSSSTTASQGGTTSTAEVRWRDGGGPELAIGERVLPLPAGEVADRAHPPVWQDEGGKRLAFVLASGDVRFVYLVGAGAYLGPSAKAPIDFRAAPDLDHALGALFENGQDRRAQLVADVTKDKGDAGVARMLIDGAAVDAREWDEAFAKLPDARAAEVKARLATLLERGKPSAGLLHAVAIVPLRDPARAPVLAARVRELADPVHEPRALAVMLRALAASDKPQAAQVACDVLGHKPFDDALVESALLAIAAAGTECPHVAALLGEDVCQPWLRCGEGGPLSGREASKQDEPLCTKDELARAVAKELERTAPDVLAQANGARPQLFAFAALVATGKVPASLASVHARRRYALVQPKEPPCESVAPGTACHCDEATVRDQTCRHGEGNLVRVGLCKFEIDDKQKKLLNVVASLPP